MLAWRPAVLLKENPTQVFSFENWKTKFINFFYRTSLVAVSTLFSVCLKLFKFQDFHENKMLNKIEVIHIWLSLWVGWVVRQKWDVIGRREIGGVEGVLEDQSFFVIIKENWISAMIREPAKSNNILLTRNLSIDPGVRQWICPFMIPLHCLWTKSNNRKIGIF